MSIEKKWKKLKVKNKGQEETTFCQNFLQKSGKTGNKFMKKYGVLKWKK